MFGAVVAMDNSNIYRMRSRLKSQSRRCSRRARSGEKMSFPRRGVKIETIHVFHLNFSPISRSPVRLTFSPFPRCSCINAVLDFSHCFRFSKISIFIRAWASVRSRYTTLSRPASGGHCFTSLAPFNINIAHCIGSANSIFYNSLARIMLMA